MINLKSKTNKSVAAAAMKVMESQPAKVTEYKPLEPIQSSLVDQVVAASKKSHFNIFANRAIKEDAARLPDDGDHVEATTKLDHKPVWPKTKQDPKTKTVSASAEDGGSKVKKEDYAAGLQNSYAAKLPPSMPEEKKVAKIRAKMAIDAMKKHLKKQKKDK